MSDVNFNGSAPGITKPGPNGFKKDWLQEYILTRNEHGRSIVVPVIAARTILTETEIRNDPASANKYVRVGPDLTLDFEARNNVSNIVTLADFLEHNQIIVYAGEMSEYRVRGRDTYDSKGSPVVTYTNELRRYIVSYEGQPYISKNELPEEEDTPARLEFAAIDKSGMIGAFADMWTDIDTQLANKYRPKSKDNPVIIRPPMISANVRKDAISGLLAKYPEREITSQDILMDQFPAWSSLTEEERQRNPWEELANLLRPYNIYTGISDEEYRRAVVSCIKGVMVGGASRLLKPTKLDVFPVLISEDQGTGKSTFTHYLGADITTLEAFKDSFAEAPYRGEIDRLKADESGDRHANNKTWESSKNKLITEFVESNALRRATINTFKILADQTKAVYSRLYENQHEEQITTTFWITTNDPNPLADNENRRFFPIQIDATRNEPLPIAAAIRDKQSSPEYDEIMEGYRELLRIARAHALELAREGHTPQEYFNEEFRNVQEIANKEIVSTDPLEAKIESIITRMAPEIFEEIGQNVNGVLCAQITEARERLQECCYSQLSPIETRGEAFARAFKTIWNGRRDNCGISLLKSNLSNEQVKKINGVTYRMIWLINPDGTPKKYRGI